MSRLSKAIGSLSLFLSGIGKGELAANRRRRTDIRETLQLLVWIITTAIGVILLCKTLIYGGDHEHMVMAVGTIGVPALARGLGNKYFPLKP